MRPVYVAGSAVARPGAGGPAGAGSSLLDCVRRALAEAGISPGDVDAALLGSRGVVAAGELADLVAQSLGDAASDGTCALEQAAERIARGHSDVCVALSWGQAGKVPEAPGLGLADPVLVAPYGLSELSVAAMRATAAVRAFPAYVQWRPEVAQRRSSLPGGARPAAGVPFLPTDLPLWSDVVAVVVLTAAPTAVQLRAVTVESDPPYLGDRDLLGMPALARAAERALTAAGTAIADVRCLEVDGLTTFDEALGLEAVGAAAEGGGMQVLAKGRLVNTDGGPGAGYAVAAMGLTRVANAYRALVDGAATHALATSSSGGGAQTQVAVVLSRSESVVSR